MDPQTDLSLWRRHREDLLRQVQQLRLAQELRQAAPRAKKIEARWSLPGDEHKIAALLELNGRPCLEALVGGWCRIVGLLYRALGR